MASGQHLLTKPILIAGRSNQSSSRFISCLAQVPTFSFHAATSAVSDQAMLNYSLNQHLTATSYSSPSETNSLSTKFFSRVFGSIPCSFVQQPTSSSLVPSPSNGCAVGVPELVGRPKATEAVAGGYQELDYILNMDMARARIWG
jgi:hypothetical protein